MNTKTNHQFLEGVKVLDLSQYIPGPFATRQLADLGADVIKIEPPSGDPMCKLFSRQGESPSLVYRHLNRGKRICRVDLKSKRGKSLLTHLLSDANVLLESFRPGVLSKLGYDHDVLTSINPSLVHCALSGYGQSGPYQQRGGHDINYLAASAVLSVSGTLEKPVISFPPIADHAGAMQASTVILAALYAQQRSGQGAYLDISLFESALSWQYLSILATKEPRGAGLLSGGAACYNIYRCADGEFVSLGALEPHFWAAFCNAISRGDWIDRQQDTLPQRELIQNLQILFQGESRAYWDALLKEVDCCYEPLRSVDSLTTHPQLSTRATLTDTGPVYAGHIDNDVPVIDDKVHEVDVSVLQHW